MLKYLAIRNFAVIDELQIEFEPGLNVLTGETGAGKSIVVEAVGLLLGGRAEATLVRTGEERATVAGAFEIDAAGPIGRSLAERGFEVDDGEVQVRREIAASGKHRAFVGAAMAPLTLLKELAPDLADQHGQHEHQTLLDPDTHLDVLDVFGGNAAAVAAVAELFERVRTLGRSLEAVQLDDREKAAKIDLYTYQLHELEQVRVQPDEEERLRTERHLLANRERLARLCSEVYRELYEGDASVVGSLGTVWRRVGELASIDAHFALGLEARDGVMAPLEELAFQVRDYAERLEVSPQRLDEVEERLALVERLKRKYGPTLADVIRRTHELREALAAMEQSAARAQELEAALADAASEYRAAAGALSHKRRSDARELARRVERELGELAMAKARLELRFDGPEKQDDRRRWTPRGIDRAEFYLAPNVGEDARPLARIASGGELSRVTLALKSVATTDRASKTLIFDEVDAGIGGQTADVVGRKLRALATRFQVLCITHLPQIAAHADVHFEVRKEVCQRRTRTVVEKLNRQGRVDAIARMIGGATVTDGVRRSAEEMVKSRT